MNTIGTPDEVIQYITNKLEEILDKKRATVKWKLSSVKEAFEREIEPFLYVRN